MEKSAILSEMDLCDKPQLLQYLKQNDLWAKKSLGQNFLVDRAALDKIVETAELKYTDTVLEIGPGVGTLTEELIGRAGEVIAIEKDDFLAKLLNNKYQISNAGSNVKFQIINQDVLEFDISTFRKGSLHSSAKNGFGRDDNAVYKLIANIPYYITSKILKKFLSAENKPEIIVLLVQKEVAERICAKPGNLSVLAVSVQYYGQPEIVDIVKRDSFFPAPEVDSAILKISKIKNQKSKTDEEYFFKIVKAGFSARRKTLFNNLKSGTNIPKEKISDIIEKIGFNQNTRAQELSVVDWQNLIIEINKITK